MDTVLANLGLLATIDLGLEAVRATRAPTAGAEVLEPLADLATGSWIHPADSPTLGRERPAQAPCSRTTMSMKTWLAADP